MSMWPSGESPTGPAAGQVAGQSHALLKVPSMVRTAALFLLLACPAVAQEVSSTVTGQFGAGSGWHYQAEVHRNAEYLALRLWEGQSPDRLSLVLDNTRFDWTPIGGQEWLEATAAGPLVLYTLSENEGYLTAGRTVLDHLDNMIVVRQQATFTNRLTGPVPKDPFRCFSEDCWSCVADPVAGTAIESGEKRVAVVAYEDLSAAFWGPDRTAVLGLCSAPD